MDINRGEDIIQEVKMINTRRRETSHQIDTSLLPTLR
jgi:hypothetical protein